jgi:hypothetical protein
MMTSAKGDVKRGGEFFSVSLFFAGQRAKYEPIPEILQASGMPEPRTELQCPRRRTEFIPLLRVFHANGMNSVPRRAFRVSRNDTEAPNATKAFPYGGPARHAAAPDFQEILSPRPIFGPAARPSAGTPNSFVGNRLQNLFILCPICSFRGRRKWTAAQVRPRQALAPSRMARM